MSTLSKPTAIRQPANRDEPDWELGWRYETVTTPDGTTQSIRVPLTYEEALHPEEGYVMPIRTSHDRIANDLCDMLRAYFADDPNDNPTDAPTDHLTTVVYHDLIFVWDHADVGNFAPDVAVVPDVREGDRELSQFVVAEEGTRPTLIIEVVSPKTRTGDRVDKVRDYALVGVQEYVFIDHWIRKGQTVWEIAGYQLTGNHYLPIGPDEDGALYLASINMRIGVDDGRVWLEDADTGEDLLTHLEVHRALQEEITARQAAEERAAALEAELAELRRQLK